MTQKPMKGETQPAAAAAADMSEKSVRNWKKALLPSERKKDRRRQSTRPDPFAGVWTEDIEPLFEPVVGRILTAPTVPEWLDGRHPGRFGRSHLRTLQRRMRDWCALNGLTVRCTSSRSIRNRIRTNLLCEVMPALCDLMLHLCLLVRIQC